MKRTIIGGKAPVFISIHEVASGGYGISPASQDLQPGTVIPAGTPVMIDPQRRNHSRFIKTAVTIIGSGMANSLAVAKNHPFSAGEIVIWALPEGGQYSSAEIVGIDKVSYGPTMDLLVIDRPTDDDLPSGTVLMSATPEEEAFARLPGLLQYDLLIPSDYRQSPENPSGRPISFSVVTRGTVYENRAPVAPEWVKKALPNIIYSTSK